MLLKNRYHNFLFNVACISKVSHSDCGYE